MSLMKSNWALSALLLGLVVEADDIKQVFLASSDVNDGALNVFGTLSGATDWVRSGFQENADMDMILTMTLRNSSNSSIDAINDYQMLMFMSVDNDSTISEFFEIRSSVKSGLTYDLMAVGSSIGVKSLNFSVGDTWPKLTPKAGYRYAITSASAVTT